MKNVFLHGGLGKAFGKKFSFDVSTPKEALRALMANHVGVKKYLIEKEAKGIHYGIRNSKEFIQVGEEDFSIPGDFHLSPIPAGGATFAINLAMMAATTALSMLVNKKMAETMKQDNETLTMQTQSYIYNGKSNHMKQGQVIPFGYGRLLIGSSVISSSVINYAWDKDAAKILFIGGPFGLLAKYNEYYGSEVFEGYTLSGKKTNLLLPFGMGHTFTGEGILVDTRENITTVTSPVTIPLGSTFFEKTPKEFNCPWLDFAKFRDEHSMTEEEKRANTLGASDPIYKALKLSAQTLAWGDGPGEYQARPPDGASTPYWLRREGNMWTGWTEYTFLGPYGGDGGGFRDLPNYNVLTGYWGGGAAKNPGLGYRMNQAEADNSVCSIVQSVPILESAPVSEKEFYPIFFEVDNEGTGDALPVTVGERYKDGATKLAKKFKEDGLGWYAFESVSVQKNVDLVCEGPIKGFCDSNGEDLEYRTVPDANPTNTTTYNGATINMRETSNDFLQAVKLNDIPVKEIKNGLDSFNFNEFDIDIARDKDGEIGAYDQQMLEPQYRFVSSTKDTNGKLYGYRKTGAQMSESAFSIKEFKENHPFKAGDYLKHAGASGDTTWSVARDLNTEWKDGEDYQKGSSVINKIVYVKTGSDHQFYEVNDQYDLMINDIKDELVDGNALWEGDFFTENGKFYEGLYDIKDVLLYDPDLSFRVGDLLVKEGSDKIWEVNTDTWFRLQPGEVKTIDLIADPSVNTIMEELKARGWVKDLSISPSSHPEFFEPINIKSPKDVYYVNTMSNPIPDKVPGVFLLAGNLSTLNVDPKEEYQLVHSIINPDVTDAVVSLQIDELMYIYGGDNMEIEYRLGPAMVGIVVAIAAANAAGIIPSGNNPGTLAKKLAAVPTAVKTVLAIAVGAFAGILASSFGIDVGDKVENSGESWPNRTKFRIKYGNEGEGMYYTDVHFYGMATSSYVKDIHINLPPNPLNKNRIIKVYRITPERNPMIEGEAAARYKERTSLGAITEITNINLNYNSSVVIGSRVVAKEMPSIPKRNFNLKLKKVQVPLSYDPETRQYADSWTGQFSEDLKWTDNPAWCLYDMITNQRYGVGKFGIKEEDVDKWTLYKMAKYCDEIVSTGHNSTYMKKPFRAVGRKLIIENILNGDEQFTREFQHNGKNLAIYYEHFKEIRKIVSAGKDSTTNEYTVILDREPTLDDGYCAAEIFYPLLEPRYTINAMLTSRQDAFKLINEMASVFRAFAYWDSGAIHFFQDEPRESLMMFTNNNVEKIGFAYSNTPRTSRANSVKLKYLDKYNEFRPKVWHSEDKEKIKQNGLMEKSMDAFGVSSMGQASRAAEYVVQGGNMETELISFRTNTAGGYLKPGDVFDVMDSKRTVGRFAGRIVDIYIDDGGQRAEIDIDFPIRTIVDVENKNTYKKIKLYTIGDSETIESLSDQVKDVAPADGVPDGVVNDDDIDALRQRQIAEFDVVNVKNNDTTLVIIGQSQYEYIEGEYTWKEAEEDANRRGGKLATISTDEELGFFKISMPENGEAWIGGVYAEDPSPSRYIWSDPQGCDDNEIRLFNFPENKGVLEEGRRIVIDSSDQHLEIDTIVEDIGVVDNAGNPIFTASGERVVIPGGSTNFSYPNYTGGLEVEYDLRDNYLYAKGSTDVLANGDWHRDVWTAKKGYMLKKKMGMEILRLYDIKGLTFMLEDNVSFAVSKKYKVLNITEESSGIFKIDGMEYDENKFKFIEENSSIPEPKNPVIFTESLIDAPDNVTLEYESSEDLRYLSSSGVWRYPAAQITAKWDKVLGAAGYKVQFFNGKDLMTTVELDNQASEFSYNSRSIRDGEPYHVRVYSITA